MLTCLFPHHPSLPSLLPSCFPLPSPLSLMLLHSVILHPFKPFCCLIFPMALPSIALFFQGFLPPSDSSTGTGGWVCPPQVTTAAQLPLQQLLVAFGNCQKNSFYFHSNNRNYRGQAVSCNALVLPGPVGTATA